MWQGWASGKPGEAGEDAFDGCDSWHWCLRSPVVNHGAQQHIGTHFTARLTRLGSLLKASLGRIQGAGWWSSLQEKNPWKNPFPSSLRLLAEFGSLQLQG